MILRLVEGPQAEPVEVADVKLDARIDEDEHDAKIGVLIAAAREAAENETGRALMPQTWELVLDRFPSCDQIVLAKAPVQSITSIKYYDADGVLQTMSADGYSLDADFLPGRVLLGYQKSWPSTRSQRNAVIVRFVAGYEDAASVPSNIKMWIRYRAATMVFQDSNIVTGAIVAQMPRDFVDGLLDPFRVYRS